MCCSGQMIFNGVACTAKTSCAINIEQMDNYTNLLTGSKICIHSAVEVRISKAYRLRGCYLPKIPKRGAPTGIVC